MNPTRRSEASDPRSYTLRLAVATALESLEESDEIEDGFVAKALASAVTPERCATATLEEGVMDVIKDAPRPGLA